MLKIHLHNNNISFYGLWRNVLSVSCNVLSFSDVESPVFERCPSKQTFSTEHGQATAAVVWNNPRAVDNSNQEPNITCVPKSGTRFPIGETNVTCTAQDESGNIAKCNFTVAVKGNWVLVFTWIILFVAWKIKKSLYVEDKNVGGYFKNTWANQNYAISNK